MLDDLAYFSAVEYPAPRAWYNFPDRSDFLVR